VTFVNKDGSEKTISVPVGMSMLEAAHENDIELEGTGSYLEISNFPTNVIPVSAYSKLMLADKNTGISILFIKE
jgi:hypothetical protein